jgi:catechol 2,3-dioxygenase-like lactoylglutathione lyase family enzyme
VAASVDFYVRILGGTPVMEGEPSIDRGAEIRCYMRDPDGHLIEVGQATGVLQ